MCLAVAFAATTSTQAPHVDPGCIADSRLRAIRADFGIYVPSVKPRCPEDPATGIRCVGDNGATAKGLVNGLVFTAHIFNYPSDQRQIIYDAYTTGLGVDGKPRAYTHMVVHIPCVPNVRAYHGIYPSYGCDGQFVNTVLHEMYD